MSGPPDFSELVGPDVPADERERLRRVHDLLVAAGPAPGPVRRAPRAGVAARRRRSVLALVAAALVAAGAFGGYLAARGGEAGFEATRVVLMRPTQRAPGASAVIRIGARDENGNWPMLLRVEGLAPLRGGYYTLLLTKNGRPVAACGTFQVGEEKVTTVRLSASYRLAEFDGWVVKPYVHGRKAFNERVLLRS